MPYTVNQNIYFSRHNFVLKKKASIILNSGMLVERNLGFFIESVLRYKSSVIKKVTDIVENIRVLPLLVDIK